MNFLGYLSNNISVDLNKLTLFERLKLRLNEKSEVLKLIIQMTKILVPFTPFVLGILYFNYLNYGGAFRSGYYFSKEESLVINFNSISLFIKYFLLFNLIYPGMYLILLITKNVFRNISILIVVITTIFYCIVTNVTFSGGIAGFIISTRLLLPVTPFLILSYLTFLSKRKDYRYYRIIYLITFIVLVLTSFTINYLHYKYLLTAPNPS
jgi:hypothetical protein